MPRKAARKSKYKLLIVLVILAISLFFLPAKYRSNPLSRGMLSLVAASNHLIGNAIRGGRITWGNYLYLVDVGRENQVLKNDIARLKQDNNHMMEYALENARLRQLLGFKAKVPLASLPAQVVSRDPTNWFKTVLINKGKSAGVVSRSTIVTHAGLVGHVIEASDRASKVLLITDPASRVAILIQRTRDEGVLAGEGKEICHLEYISNLADVKIGDVVISSGLGGVFPKGLKVGVVTSVERQEHSLFKTVQVVPSADLSRLEEVLVFKKDAEDEIPATEEVKTD